MDKVYLPFWIVLEYLDQTPPDAFIPCYILQSETHGDTTFYEVALYEKESDLKAYNIPAQYVIKAEHLIEWGGRIADWFNESARKYVESDA
jgi:hypothetical protein